MLEANFLISIGLIFILIKVLNKHNVMKDMTEGRVVKSRKDCLIEDYESFIIFKNKDNKFKAQMTLEEFYLANPKLKGKIKVIKKEAVKPIIEKEKKPIKEISLKDKVKKDINDKYSRK